MSTPIQEPQTPQAAPTVESLKIVIVIKDGRGSIGVSSPGRDPHIVTLEMASAESLDQVLAEIPGIVEIARLRWLTAPQNPKYQRPPPPRPAAAARAPRAARAAPAQTQPAQEQDQRLF